MKNQCSHKIVKLRAHPTCHNSAIICEKNCQREQLHCFGKHQEFTKLQFQQSWATIYQKARSETEQLRHEIDLIEFDAINQIQQKKKLCLNQIHEIEIEMLRCILVKEGSGLNKNTFEKMINERFDQIKCSEVSEIERIKNVNILIFPKVFEKKLIQIKNEFEKMDEMGRLFNERKCFSQKSLVKQLKIEQKIQKNQLREQLRQSNRQKSMLFENGGEDAIIKIEDIESNSQNKCMKIEEEILEEKQSLKEIISQEKQYQSLLIQKAKEILATDQISELKFTKPVNINSPFKSHQLPAKPDHHTNSQISKTPIKETPKQSKQQNHLKKAVYPSKEGSHTNSSIDIALKLLQNFEQEKIQKAKIIKEMQERQRQLQKQLEEKLKKEKEKEVKKNEINGKQAVQNLKLDELESNFQNQQEKSKLPFSS